MARHAGAPGGPEGRKGAAAAPALSRRPGPHLPVRSPAAPVPAPGAPRARPGGAHALPGHRGAGGARGLCRLRGRPGRRTPPERAHAGAAAARGLRGAEGAELRPAGPAPDARERVRGAAAHDDAAGAGPVPVPGRAGGLRRVAPDRLRGLLGRPRRRVRPHRGGVQRAAPPGGGQRASRPRPAAHAAGLRGAPDGGERVGGGAAGGGRQLPPVQPVPDGGGRAAQRGRGGLRPGARGGPGVSGGAAAAAGAARPGPDGGAVRPHLPAAHVPHASGDLLLAAAVRAGGRGVSHRGRRPAVPRAGPPVPAPLRLGEPPAPRDALPHALRGGAVPRRGVAAVLRPLRRQAARRHGGVLRARDRLRGGWARARLAGPAAVPAHRALGLLHGGVRRAAAHRGDCRGGGHRWAAGGPPGRG